MQSYNHPEQGMMIDPESTPPFRRRHNTTNSSSSSSKEVTTSEITPTTSMETDPVVVVPSTNAYTADQVAQHASKDDCWLILGKHKPPAATGAKVYNVTSFLDQHPGGARILLKVAGQNADAMFEDFGHSRKARRMLETYCIGDFLATSSQQQQPQPNQHVTATTTTKTTIKPVASTKQQGEGLDIHNSNNDKQDDDNDDDEEQLQQPEQARLVAASISSCTSRPNDKATPGSNDFYWSSTEEPHAARRQEILSHHPQIQELYGYDPYARYVCLALVALQVFLAYATTRSPGWMPFWVLFVAAYVIGGTCNHMCMLAMHELSHNLMFESIAHNRLFSHFVNLPIGLPAAISFKRYHLEHHKYQGEDRIDMDVPTQMEGRIIQNRCTKLLYVIFQIFFYALRPVLASPKKPTAWEAANLVCCLAFDAILIVTMGPWSIFYLLLSTFLGAGLHPVAGHFISEHYLIANRTKDIHDNDNNDLHDNNVVQHETFSYYGPLNLFAFNVGYHNEHHDFPNIPGSRLPQVRRMAPEYYDTLPQCPSWPGDLYQYIMDPHVMAFSRVKRHTLSEADIAAIKAT